MRPACGGGAVSLARSIPPQHEAGIVAEGSVAAAPAWRLGAAPDLVARYHDGYRRALRRGRLLPGGRFRFCFRPRRAAGARGRGPLRDRWRCASSNWPTPSSPPSAASAAMTRSTPRIAPTCGARRSMPINADCCSRSPSTRTHLPIRATEASVIFGLIVQRLEKLGIETFCLDLTRQRFAVPVVRVIAPGLQLEPSEIVTARLRDTIARTGGGATYTGGVALI